MEIEKAHRKIRNIQIDQSDVWKSKFEGKRIIGPFRVSNPELVSYPSLEDIFRFA
jgi:hypothetical protein